MNVSQDAVEVTVTWKEELAFEAVTSRGMKWTVDSDGKAGAKPTEGLLGALGSCMAIDVVMILQKMRTDLKGLEVKVFGWRQEEPPRYFSRARLDFYVTGSVEDSKVERAIALSFDKYCSVFHTLRKDLEISHTVNRVP